MSLTVIVITLSVSLLIAYDIWTIWRRGYKTSISWILYSWGRNYPVIPFALGFLFGHLFWSNSATPAPVGPPPIHEDSP